MLYSYTSLFRNKTRAFKNAQNEKQNKTKYMGFLKLWQILKQFLRAF